MKNDNYNNNTVKRDDVVYDDIKRGLNDFFVSAGYIYTSKYLAGYDDKMKAVLEQYKREMLQWFSGSGVSTENPMKHVAQAHWYNLYLEKKRLENQRCKVEYEEYKQISRNPLEDAETSFLYWPDGKYLVCEASETTSIKKNYIRNGAVIAKEQQICEVCYYILRAQNKEGLYICPNCGREQPLDKLLDGCDYCKSQFSISAYDDKVTSVTKHNNRFEGRTVYENKTPTSAIALAVLGTIGIFFGVMLALITLGLSLLFAVAGGVAIYFAFKQSIEANKNVPQAGSIKYRLQDYNPGFSEEEFIGSLDCKLKAIHYASDTRELAAFVKCDVTPYVKSYQNIINCETGRISYKSFQIRGDYQYLELHREIKVMQDYGNYLKSGRGIVKVTLAKKVKHKLKNDAVLYRCKGCGMAISLLEGGKCKYCGNEIEYALYDWVVVGYKHVKVL